jgi:hypothetical protein
MQLYTTIFNSKSEERAEDFIYSLHKNSELFDSIIVFTERNPRVIFRNNIKIIPTFKRPTFSSIFHYIKTNMLESNLPCIVANGDIVFDRSIFGLNSMPPNFFAAISKREPAGDFASQGRTEITQDAWCFYPNLLSEAIIDQSCFYLGTMGCDNRLAAIFLMSGFTLVNPCKSIFLQHIHSSFSPAPEEHRVYGQYCLIPACGVSDFPNPPKVILGEFAKP